MVSRRGRTNSHSGMSCGDEKDSKPFKKQKMNQTQDQTVVSSPADKRRYKCFQLKNGLECLLIDEDNDRPDPEAAVSLSVRVGYFSDPPEIPGLAHFLEHMLFLGTEAYPGENDWESYLSRKGGSSNACTDSEITTFTWDISSKYLKQGLQRFSKFFICPLFDENGSEREIEAVNSEFMDCLQSDEERLSSVLYHVINPNHVFHKFGWGNKDTLSTQVAEQKIDLRSALLSFHKKYYSAHAMKLVILGKHVANADFAEFVREQFEPIPSSYEPLPNFSNLGPVFGPDAAAHLFQITSVKPSTLLTVMWPVPRGAADFKTKPLAFVSHLLGHEGPGSLLAALMDFGWVSELYTAIEECVSCTWFFECTLHLTPGGLEHMQQVGTHITPMEWHVDCTVQTTFPLHTGSRLDVSIRGLITAVPCEVRMYIVALCVGEVGGADAIGCLFAIFFIPVRISTCLFFVVH